MSEPTLTGPVEPEQPPPAATVAADAGAGGNETPASPPGYELRELVGRGGMGAVYRARDVELGREVAVKILLPNYAPGSATARRFVDEASITARLQHPGIPAIYRVGQLADGRPFLAMKLIDGRTLDEALRTLTAQDKSDPEQPDLAHRLNSRLDRLEEILQRGRLLAIFEQLAQAVGYAHQHGVIHRDLKPANIMVGAFGEVQVMDWGIARSGARHTASARAGTETTATVDYAPAEFHTPQADLTQAGSILGTPAFMPPEQAIGAIDQIGKRSDVFGLGAILCVILTGQPPFVAESAETTRQLAARGKLDDCFGRLDSCGAEPELVALAKKCLAPDAADRPENADEVAKAVAGLRAAAEHRARQAETDRATAEVRVAEERKRRRVQRVLALALLALLVVVGYTARRIDNEQARQRSEREQQLRQRAEDANARVVALRARQLVTERDVDAALGEVHVLREQGLKQTDDPERWALTLVAARSALKRAEGLLASGEPTDGPVRRVADAGTELARDDRDRGLLAELDRIGEENDIRFLFPLALSRRPPERYKEAFRKYGIDLTTEPHARAATWLKGHRFRARLTAAVRSWRYSVPTTDVRGLFGREAADPLAAAGGGLAAATRTDLAVRLAALADAATDDPFAREWWTAVARRDTGTLAELLTRPEMERLPSEELAVFAEGLHYRNVESDEEAGVSAILAELLQEAYKRFPEGYWVNFRLAQHGPDVPGGEGKKRPALIRHLSAAVAARPRSAAARTALAVALLDEDENDPTAVALLTGAADLDPASVWAPLILAETSLRLDEPETAGEWVARAVRADPDTGFFLVNTLLFRGEIGATGKQPSPSRAFIRAALDRLVREHPAHPGGYDIRAGFRLQDNDYAGALADMRAALALPRAAALSTGNALQLPRLERLARWKEKLPAVLRGELKPTPNDLRDLAEYCAGFEQKFALATRFAGEALATVPGLYTDLFTVPRFAGWAVRASTGAGADAAGLSAEERTRLRKQALAWLQKNLKEQALNELAFAVQVWENPDLEPVRPGELLRKLPAAEREAWRAFWASVANPLAPTEVAPAPREVKP